MSKNWTTSCLALALLKLTTTTKTITLLCKVPSRGLHWPRCVSRIGFTALTARYEASFAAPTLSSMRKHRSLSCASAASESMTDFALTQITTPRNCASHGINIICTICIGRLDASRRFEAHRPFSNRNGPRSPRLDRTTASIFRKRNGCASFLAD